MAAPPLPQSSLPLAPMVDKRPPKYRIGSASEAQQIVQLLWEGAKQRNLRNAAIQGQIDGNPPYSPTKLRAQGRAGDPNFNTLEAKALLSAALVPYYDLFAGDGRYVDIRTEFGTSKQRTEWSNIITEEYDRLLHRWENFDYQMQSMLRDYAAFGKGYQVWNPNGSWHLSKVAHYRVLVPDATSIDLDDLELLVVIQDWPVEKLYSKIKDRKVASDLGWNVQEVLTSIEGAVPVDPNVTDDPIESQRMLRDSDLYVSTRSSVVPAATIYSKEYSGKWSECMIRRSVLPDDRTGIAKSNGEYMFEKKSAHDSILDVIIPFFFEVMDGSWNGASGLGRDVFTLMQLNDRMACSMSQAAFLRNSLVLQPKQALDKQRMNLLQVGAVTWIPPEVDVKESGILGDIRTPIEVRRELGTMTERNTGIYRPSLAKDPGNPRTKTEFEMIFAQANALSVSSVNRFYSQLDRLYETQYERVIKPRDKSLGSWAEEARLFVKRCQDRGVPREAINKTEYVKAWRKIGSGSQAMRAQVLSQYLSFYQLLRDQGRENLLREIISVTGSQSQVDRLMPQEDWQPEPSDQQEVGLLENAAIKIGAPVTWTPSQNNIVHANIHLQAAAQAAASLQKGANPVEILQFIDGIGAHTLVHLKKESDNPTSKNEVQVLTRQWKQLSSVADKLRARVKQQADQMASQRQRTDQVLSDQQLKKIETAGKLQISREKAAGTLQLKKERQDAEMALKDASTAADIHRENVKTVAEVQRKRFSAFEETQS